jgi:hypothetical protein
MAGEPAHGPSPERGSGVGLFVVEDLAVGQAGAIVDGGVDVAVAGIAVAAHAVFGTSPVHPPSTTGGYGSELLHIDMHQLAWTVPLVARWATGRIAGPVTTIEASQAGLAQDQLDRRGGQAHLMGDVVSTPAPPAPQLDHPIPEPARGPSG